MIYSDLMDQIAAKIDSLGLYATATIGALPIGDSIAIDIGAGSQKSIHFDRASENEVYITVNAKHGEKIKPLDALDEIHLALQHDAGITGGTDWQFVSVETGSIPKYIGVDDGNRFVYGSIIKVNIYIRGKQ